MLNLGATADSVIGAGQEAATVTNSLDAALLARLATTIEQATAAFEAYDYARALNVTEQFFWQFTDDYVELVKDRAYGGHGEAEQASVVTTLATTLDALLRLLAPFQPFATEEVWSWWRASSVHLAAWPSADTLAGMAGTADAEVLAVVAEALSGVRKAKSEAKVKQRTEVRSATVTAPAEALERLRGGLADLKAAGNIAELDLVEGVPSDDQRLAVSDVQLAPAED